MNDNEPVLAELRKIRAWADTQGRITKWSLIGIAILVPALIVFGIVMEKRLKMSLDYMPTPEKPRQPIWPDVDWNIRRADFDEAVRIGEELIKRAPQYPEGHRQLASAYLAAGRIEKSQEHYAEAFRLFPSEENGKFLAAINERINKASVQPDGAAHRSQPIRSGTNRASSAAAPLR